MNLNVVDPRLAAGRGEEFSASRKVITIFQKSTVANLTVMEPFIPIFHCKPLDHDLQGSITLTI